WPSPVVEETFVRTIARTFARSIAWPTLKACSGHVNPEHELDAGPAGEPNVPSRPRPDAQGDRRARRCPRLDGIPGAAPARTGRRLVGLGPAGAGGRGRTGLSPQSVGGEPADAQYHDPRCRHAATHRRRGRHDLPGPRGSRHESGLLGTAVEPTRRP